MNRIPRMMRNGIGAQDRINAFLVKNGRHTKLVLTRIIFVSVYPRIIRIASVEKEVA